APGVDEVVLAYARWKGRTHELGVDREAEKATLDRLLDDIEPEEWRELKDIIGEVDDKLLVEVMRYSAERALEQSKELVRDIKGLESEHEQDMDDEPEPTKKRRGR